MGRHMGGGGKQILNGCYFLILVKKIFLALITFEVSDLFIVGECI